ncbi:hypothetical protein SAMN04488036_103182 [Shimia haliotis]|uniref:Uncharacterized protein n=1 Tax=Shimia haliotis TaxID=1280847 RepID=A0A1I4DIH2_9RHOB|nr:hypothetical protein SAMN04488036_103182 [Shimia haliotis]
MGNVTPIYISLRCKSRKVLQMRKTKERAEAFTLLIRKPQSAAAPCDANPFRSLRRSSNSDFNSASGIPVA